jgi:predicted nucleotidyltransferase
MTSQRKDRKMHRNTADRLLEGVRERIAEVNSNEDYCYSITEAYVFGSYVNSDRDMISDLDIALRVERRCSTDSEQYRRRQAECPYGDVFLQLVWPKEEVLRFIRNRSGYISIHTLGDVEQDAIIFSDRTIRLEVERYGDRGIRFDRQGNCFRNGKS